MRERQLRAIDFAWIVLAVAVVLGALQAAGSLADHGYTIVPGIIGGALAAALGYFAAQSLFDRVRRRLDSESQATCRSTARTRGWSAPGSRSSSRRSRSC